MSEEQASTAPAAAPAGSPIAQLRAAHQEVVAAVDGDHLDLRIPGYGGRAVLRCMRGDPDVYVQLAEHLQRAAKVTKQNDGELVQSIAARTISTACNEPGGGLLWCDDPVESVDVLVSLDGVEDEPSPLHRVREAFGWPDELRASGVVRQLYVNPFALFDDAERVSDWMRATPEARQRAEGK